LRAINGTLRAAAPIRFRTGRAAFAVHMARERDWKPCHATPGRGIGDGRRVDRRATPMQWGNLDRPKSCVKRACPSFVGRMRRSGRSAAARVSGFR